MYHFNIMDQSSLIIPSISTYSVVKVGSGGFIPSFTPPLVRSPYQPIIAHCS